MHLNATGATAGGGMISSSALMFIVGSAVLIFLSHKGIASWLKTRHTAVREHFYGPEKLYMADPAGQDGSTDEQSGDASGGADPDDGFDYSIFSTAPPNSP